MLNKLSLSLLLGYFIFRTILILANQQPQITVLDVGQGDAILIRTSTGKLILIDGGPDYGVDWLIQDSFIFNSCQLELVVLTHPHFDHLRGLNRLFQRCRVKYVLFDYFNYDSRAYKLWLQETKKAKVLDFTAGDLLRIDEINLLILWPPLNGYENKNTNNASLVLFLDSGKFEALLTGDLEEDAADKVPFDLIESYLDGRLELYKAAHHGSTNGHNPELIKKLKPLLCAISVGEGNRYAHPHMKVLDSLKDLGCPVKRTDEDGNIEVLIE